jgi:hypothetical protein
MKKVLYFSASLLLFFASCTKDKTTNIVPPATLAGEWYGMYGSSPTAIPSAPYYFNLRNNMTMKIAAYDTSVNYFADTSYFIVPGDSIKCTYQYRNKTGSKYYSTYTIIAKANKNYSFMAGSWGFGKNAYNGGPFFMGRKQE